MTEEFFEWNNSIDRDEDLLADGFPKTGFNAATGLLADDSKQKTIRPFPIEQGKNGKFYMKTDGNYQKLTKSNKSSKAAAQAQGVFLDL